MKPIELTMNAFGTFAGECTISFEKLSKDSVFLITGDTGAGKTTIFDALCFALYGTSSGDSRSKDVSCFRSHYAKENSHTYVILTFSCKDKIYKIIRNPKYTYRKVSKSDKLSTRSANADLYEICGDYNEENILICCGSKPVTDKIEDITGMTSEQFRRIIMIAQGEFQKFLFADTTEKESILQKLFNTQPYGMIKDKLSEKYSTLKKNTDFQKLEIISDLKRISPLNDSRKQEYLSELAKESLMTKQSISNMCRMIEDSRETAEKNILMLENYRNSVSVKRDSLKADIEKGKIHNDKILKYNSRKSEFLKIKKNILLAQNSFNLAKADSEKIPALEKDFNLLLDRMEKYNTLEFLKTEIFSLEKQFNYKSSIVSHHKTLIDNIKSKIDFLNDYFNNNTDPEITLEKITSVLKEKNHSLKELQEKSDKLVLYKNTLIQLNKYQNAYSMAYNNYFNIEKPVFDEIEKKFYLSSASILAETLKDNFPCPVCGSKIHPSPALRTSDTVSQQQYQDAKSKLELSSDKLNKAKNILDKQQTLANERKIDDDENISRELLSLKQEINSLELQKNSVKSQIENDYRKREELGNLRKSLAQSEDEYNKILSSLNELQNKLSAKKAEQILIGKDLSFPDRKTAQLHLDNLSNQINKYKSQLELTEKNLRILETNEKSLSDSLKDLETEINGAAEYNVTENELKYKSLLEEEKNISDKISALRSHCENCSEISENVKEKSEKFFSDERQTLLYKELIDKISGNFAGAERISFESFVQAYYLNQILDNANLKLNVLSKGRYSLNRCTSEKKHNYKAGLNIEVLDNYTGLTRSVKTLSGGETFLASLSLALGLSDTVQHKSGGIRLDAMFIDEGFGSLDSETLESVIKILEKLSGNNRMIGIISHVSELSERFDNKLIVTKSEHGSSVKITEN